MVNGVDVDDETKRKFAFGWADRMYGPKAIVADTDLREHFATFAKEWLVRFERIWPKSVDEGGHIFTLEAAWRSRQAASEVEHLARKLQENVFRALGGSRTKKDGANFMKDDEFGTPTWERDCLAYWMSRVKMRPASEIVHQVWPGQKRLPDYVKTRTDAVRRLLVKLGPLPERRMAASTELHPNSSFVNLDFLRQNYSGS